MTPQQERSLEDWDGFTKAVGGSMGSVVDDLDTLGDFHESNPHASGSAPKAIAYANFDDLMVDLEENMAVCNQHKNTADVACDHALKQVIPPALYNGCCIKK